MAGTLRRPKECLLLIEIASHGVGTTANEA